MITIWYCLSCLNLESFLDLFYYDYQEPLNLKHSLFFRTIGWEDVIGSRTNTQMYVVNALFIEDGPTFPMNGALLYGFISLYILFMILINLIYSFGWPYHLRTVSYQRWYNNIDYIIGKNLHTHRPKLRILLQHSVMCKSYFLLFFTLFKQNGK